MSKRRQPDTPAGDDLLNAALGYAQAGVRVFPCHTVRDDGSCTCRTASCTSVGKHPRTRKGHSEATTDATKIEQWWRRWPDANVGAIPGPRYVIMDVDPWKEGERDNLDALRREVGPLPETFVVQTGRHEIDGGTERGEHRWYRVPEDVEISKTTICGVEVKGTGGYVLVPPSRHRSGVVYETTGTLDDAVIVPRKIAEAGTPHADAEPLGSTLTDVPVGRRASDAIETGYLPQADDGSSQREVLVGIVRNLREAGTPVEVTRAIVDGWMDDGRSSLDPLRPWTRRDGRQVVDSVYRTSAPDRDRFAKDADVTSTTSRLKMLSLTDAARIANEPVDWVIPDLLAAGEKAVIAGPPKSMKTWLALHLLRCVAIGGDILSEAQWRVADPQAVLFVQEEGSAQRWSRRLMQTFEGDLSAPFAYVHRGGFALTAEQNVDWVIEQARTHHARLIVLDPWQRVTPGVKENDATETGPAWDAVHRIASETNAAVIVIHHASKGDGPPTMDSIRGSSRMAGEVDLILVLRKKDGGALEMYLDGREYRSADGEDGNLELSYTPDRPYEMRTTGVKIRQGGSKGDNVQVAIVNVLADASDAMTTKAISTAVNDVRKKPVTDEYVRQKLKVLAEDGRVEEISGGKGHPTKWWRAE